MGLHLNLTGSKQDQRQAACSPSKEHCYSKQTEGSDVDGEHVVGLHMGRKRKHVAFWTGKLKERKPRLT
jgi:hypothetical protein